MDRRKSLGVVFLALALIAAGVVFLLIGRDREPETAGLHARSAPPEQGGGVELMGRSADEAPAQPVPRAEPAALRPAATRGPVPAGSLRVIVRIPGRRAGDRSRVGITVLRDGVGLGSLFWWPDEGPFPYKPATALGPRAEVVPEPEGATVEEASALLSGIEAGEYVLFARLVTNAPEPSQQAVAHATVRADQGATARIELPSAQGMAALTVRVTRAGGPASADVKLRLGTLTLESLSVTEAAGTTVAVVAGVDLEVLVDSYPGSREFDPVPPRKVRLSAGQSETVTVELPVGVLVNVQAVDRSQEPVRFGLSVWRLPDRGHPQHIESAMQVRDNDTALWTGRLPPGRYALKGFAGAADGWQTLDVVSPGPMDVRIPLREYQGRSLRTRWLEADGSPAVGLHLILVRDVVPSLQDSLVFYATTDQDGRATLPPLREGEYGVWLWQRHLHRRVEVGADGPVDFEARLPGTPKPERSATFRGNLKHPGGEPASQPVLLGRDGSEWSVIVRPNGGGVFEATGLEPGPVRIRIPFSWWSRVAYRPHAETFRLLPGENPHEIVLRAP